MARIDARWHRTYIGSVEVTVQHTKGTLVIDSATQTAFMLPADVTWADDGVTGTMTLTYLTGRIVARRLSIDSERDELDAMDYAVRRLRNVVKEAQKKLAIRVSVDGSTMEVQTTPDQMGAEQVVARRWRRMSPDFLEAVADCYNAAQAAGEPPVKSIIDQFAANRNTVNEWVRSARKAGLIAPTKPRADE